MNNHFEHIFHQLLHLDLIADRFPKEDLFDGQRRNESKRRDEREQLNEPIRFRRILLMEIRVKKELSLVVQRRDGLRIVE